MRRNHGIIVQVACKNGRVISLGIWDTAGAERFEALSRMYYNGAKAAVLAFDPCNAKSFEKLKFWVRIAFFYLLTPLNGRMQP